MVDEATFATKSICLDDIARKSDWCRMDAAGILEYTKTLVSLPCWETEAEDAIKKSLEKQIEALQSTIEAYYLICRKRHIANTRKVPIHADN